MSSSVRLGQSTSCQRGFGLSLWGEGGRREIKIGMWSDPVEGREDESHERKAEKSFWVGESKVNGALSMSSCKWEPGVDARGIKERVAQVCGSAEVWGGFSFFLRGKESGGVRCRVVDIKVAGDQIENIKNREGCLWGDRVGGRGELSGIGVANSKAGKVQAETAFRGVYVASHEVV